MKRMNEYILGYVKKYKIQFLVMCLCVQATTFLSSIYPNILGKILDTIIYNFKLDLFMLEVSKYGLVFCAALVAQFMIDFFWARLNASFLVDIRAQLFQHILRLKGKIINGYNYGDFLTRINYDCDQILSYIHGSIFHFIACILMIFLSLINIFVINPFLGILVVIFTPLTSLLAKIMSKYIEKKYIQYKSQSANIYSLLYQITNRVWEVKLILSAKSVCNYSIKKIHEVNGLKEKVSYFELLSERINAFVLLLIQLGIFWFSSYLISYNKISVGDFVAIFTYYGICVSKYGFLNHKLATIKDKTVSIERIVRLYEEEEEDIEYIDENSKVKEGSIHFENVTFGYEEDKPCLNQVSFHLYPNKFNAIIGENGSGKSTIAHLLCKIYDVNQGEIKIDNNNIDSISLKNLRENISIIYQENEALETSVYKNLVGTKEIPVENVWEVLKQVDLYAHIKTLPEGLETIVDKKISFLSGGQKQRFWFAKILLENKKIIILDEAFSALDDIALRKMLNLLQQIKENKTIIFITHSNVTIRFAEHCVVLNKGNIEYEGNLKFVMHQSKECQRLFSDQSFL